MTDEQPTHQDRLKGILGQDGKAAPPPKKEAEAEEGEGFVRSVWLSAGTSATRPAAVEFRFRDGNSIWFPYGWLGTWQYNPSEGLLLKFSGDLVYLVLIRGSNLDKPLNEGAINLTTGGLQRHRVLWIREMTRRRHQASVGETGPTIDSIEVGGVRVAGRSQGMAQQERPGVLTNAVT